MRNVEIKAVAAQFGRLAEQAARLADSGPFELEQDDTFFRTTAGRLKLRCFAREQAQLIYYERDDRNGPKTSFYQIIAIPDPDGLREALRLAWGIRGRVRKQRTLYLVGRTRVHLDRVEGLGDYLELEVVLSDSESSADGEREARRLMACLGISNDQLVSGAYIDLLEQAQARRTT